VEDLQRQLESATKEQEALIDIFSEERSRRDQEEDSLKKKLKVSVNKLLRQFSVWCVACSQQSRTLFLSRLVVHFVQIVSSLQEASLTIQDLLEQLNNARKGRKF
jgi:hypothetical protein